jgi:SAM-dependent methyltransferase
VTGRTGKADYSKIAGGYDAARRLPADAMTKWTGLIRDSGRLGPGSLCLDLGCGTGRFTIPAGRLSGAQMVGADLSAEMLEEAGWKPGAERVWWVRCDAHSLPFGTGTFRCVFMSLLLHHVDDMDRVIAECCRALALGGTCLIRTSAHEDMETMPVYSFFPGAWEIDRNRLPAIGVIEDSIRRAGFGNVRHEKVVQELVPSAEAYMDKIRRRNISALTMLSNEEFEEGLRRMESHFASIGEDAARAEVARERLTLVIGER